MSSELDHAAIDESTKMGGIETYPVPLEAVLRAEVRVLDAELEASWTLQGAGIVLAVRA